MPRFAHLLVLTGAVALAAGAPALAADEPVLNLYSARHYQTDEALYDNFTKATGIKINRIEAGDEQLVERLKNEGAGKPRRRAADRRCRAAVAGAAARPVRAREIGGARGEDPRQVPRSRGQLVRLLVSRARDRLQQVDDRRRPTSRRTRRWPIRRTRAGSARARAAIPTTCRSSAPRSRTSATRRPKRGRRASSPTWRARRRAATPTRSRPSPRASARSRCRTRTTTRASCARRSRRTRRSPRRPASCFPTRRATARTSTSRAPAC